MCSECGDDQPVCSFCGDACYGSCGDLDTCPSCWTYKHDPIEMDIYDEEAMEDCMDAQCLCHCHDDVHAECGMRYEHGVWKDEETDGPPFEREGVFPFLKLPGELREKIYGFAFLQDGNQRRFPDTYHRGTIHTALLRTCRQVHEESGNLPLSLNTLKFPSALFALNFLGFSLLPNQRHLMTRIHIEFFYHEFSSASWELLLRQLAKMPITHLGLTIKGGCWKESFLGHTCFASRFAAMMKGVKTLEVTLGSCKITKAIKKEIQEEMREVLVKGYKPPKNADLKTKRSPTSENGDKKLPKRAKKGVNTVSTTTLAVS